MTFWKKRKNKFEYFKSDFSDDQGDSQKEVETIYRRQDVILKKLDIQERLLQRQSRQIEGLLEALNNINTALESNNIVLKELVK